ncbi:uracil-DNA glycosylase family protein [Flavobacteriaceae bacterium M23B6Z8]
MFLHTHPYPPFIPENATKLIVGTLPPPRFTTGDLLEGDVNFCYGSRDGQLWSILDRIFNLDLKFENSEEAVMQRKEFLIRQKIGICDIVAQCHRKKIDASDLGMVNPVLRDLIGHLRKYNTVQTLLFMGGGSKNGPEYFFRKLLKEQKISLRIKSNEVPRIHQIEFDDRVVKTVSLTAPSGSANRAVGSFPLYKKLKSQDPSFTAIDFRVMQYEPFFKE